MLLLCECRRMSLESRALAEMQVYWLDKIRLPSAQRKRIAPAFWSAGSEFAGNSHNDVDLELSCSLLLAGNQQPRIFELTNQAVNGFITE
jgi:hypothetical protein